MIKKYLFVLLLAKYLWLKSVYIFEMGGDTQLINVKDESVA